MWKCKHRTIFPSEMPQRRTLGFSGRSSRIRVAQLKIIDVQFLMLFCVNQFASSDLETFDATTSEKVVQFFMLLGKNTQLQVVDSKVAATSSCSLV